MNEEQVLSALLDQEMLPLFCSPEEDIIEIVKTFYDAGVNIIDVQTDEKKH